MDEELKKLFEVRAELDARELNEKMYNYICRFIPAELQE